MKIWEKIKEISTSVWSWIKRVAGKSDDFVGKYAPLAVNVCNWIKEFNDSPGADIVERIAESVGKKHGISFIPAVRKWLTNNLPKIIDTLNLSSSVAKEATLTDKIMAAKEAIDKMDSNMKASVWASIATMLAEDLSDGKLSWSESITLIAYVYDNRINENA